jgi:hypothetical protein
MLNTALSFKKLFALTLIAVLFVSCDPKKKIETEKINTQNFSMDIPINLGKTDDLNDAAVVQYQDLINDFYVMVIEEPKSGFATAVETAIYQTTPDLKGYFKVIKEHFKTTSKDLEVTDVINSRINSCNAITFSMLGENTELKLKIFYRYAVIEDDKNYYQLMTWTSSTNKEESIDKMNEIIKSFKSNSVSNKKLAK